MERRVTTADALGEPGNRWRPAGTDGDSPARGELERLSIHESLPVHPEPLWRIDFRSGSRCRCVRPDHIRGRHNQRSQSHHLAGRLGRSRSAWAGPGQRPGRAATFAGAIAAATLAFVAIVFATTLVAIQLAASQYSPRTVRSSSAPG